MMVLGPRYRFELELHRNGSMLWSILSARRLGLSGLRDVQIIVSWTSSIEAIRRDTARIQGGWSSDTVVCQWRGIYSFRRHLRLQGILPCASANRDS